MQSVQDTWYVQVNGQAYGPYGSAQMKAFVAEGRVAPQSLISQSAAQGYQPAQAFAVFAAWSGQQAVAQQPYAQAQPQTHVLRPMSNVGGGVLARQMQPTTYEPQSVVPNPSPTAQPQTAQHIHPKTVFVVMAEIRSDNGMHFLQALQHNGIAQRIGDSVWLLKSQTSVEQLRNSLSQTLTKDDRLFLLDSFKNQTAWFNIGSDMDVRIRELWDMDL